MYSKKGLVKQLEALLRKEPAMTLGNAAEKLGVNRDTLAAAVLAITGKTYRDLRRATILRATLEHFADRPELSIKETSFLLGFRHPQTFARFIKTTTGMTPTALRSLVLRAEASASSALTLEQLLEIL